MIPCAGAMFAGDVTLAEFLYGIVGRFFRLIRPLLIQGEMKLVIIFFRKFLHWAKICLIKFLVQIIYGTRKKLNRTMGP